MAMSTYAELQTEVSNQLKRSDLTARIPVYIQLAEARMNRQLRARAMITTATLNPSTTLKTLALPTGWMETISFVDDLGDELEAVTFDELESLAYGTDKARPTYYATADQIYFDRIADDTYNYKMRYYKRLDLATDLSNDIPTEAPDIYLYGALAMSAPDLKDDQRVGLWNSIWSSAMREYTHQENRSRRQLRTEFTGRSFNIIRGF